MSDHQHLHDAFAEYERQADAVGASRRSAARSRSGLAARGPVLLVAASVVLVLAIAGGVVWLAGGTGSNGTKQPAGDGQVAPASSSAPVSTSAPTPARQPSSSAPVSSATPHVSVPPPRSSGATSAPVPPPSSPPTTATPTSSAPGGSSAVPSNARQMKIALSRVLGDTATFTVDQHYGNYLIGVLTATSSGAQGGFDIQAMQGSPGDKAICEDPGKGSHCTRRATADGGSLSKERETYQGGAGVLYFADYVFPDGASFLMHLSTRSDPKGGGASYGSTPPLTLKQVAAIVRSDRWGAGH